MNPYKLQNLSNRDLRDQLENQEACQEALDWLGERDLRTAWAECPHLDWLDWYVGNIAPFEAETHFHTTRKQALKKAKTQMANIDYTKLTPEEDEKLIDQVWDTFCQSCRNAIEIVDEEVPHVAP